MFCASIPLLTTSYSIMRLLAASYHFLLLAPPYCFCRLLLRFTSSRHFLTHLTRFFSTSHHFVPHHTTSCHFLPTLLDRSSFVFWLFLSTSYSTILFKLNLLSSSFSDPPTTFNHSVPVLQHLAASLYFLQRLTTSYHFVPLHPASYHILLSFTSCYFFVPPLTASFCFVLPRVTSVHLEQFLAMSPRSWYLLQPFVASHHLLPPLVTWSYFSLLPTMSCTHLPLLTNSYQFSPRLTSPHRLLQPITNYGHIFSLPIASQLQTTAFQFYRFLPLLTISYFVTVSDFFSARRATSAHYLSPPFTSCHLLPLPPTSRHVLPPLTTSSHVSPLRTTSCLFFHLLPLLPRLNTSFQSSQRPTTSHHACPLRPTPSTSHHFLPLLATSYHIVSILSTYCYVLLLLTIACHATVFNFLAHLITCHHVSSIRKAPSRLTGLTTSKHFSQIRVTISPSTSNHFQLFLRPSCHFLLLLPPVLPHFVMYLFLSAASCYILLFRNLLETHRKTLDHMFSLFTASSSRFFRTAMYYHFSFFLVFYHFVPLVATSHHVQPILTTPFHVVPLLTFFTTPHHIVSLPTTYHHVLPLFAIHCHTNSFHFLPLLTTSHHVPPCLSTAFHFVHHLSPLLNTYYHSVSLVTTYYHVIPLLALLFMPSLSISCLFSSPLNTFHR